MDRTLPDDWEDQIVRAYTVFGVDPDGMEEFAWRFPRLSTEFLREKAQEQLRDIQGRFRRMRAKLGLGEQDRPVHISAIRSEPKHSLDDLPVLDGIPASTAPKGYRPKQMPDGTIVFHKPDYPLDPGGPDLPLQYLYRSVSEEEWEHIKKTGHMQSDERMNLEQGEGTVASHRDPSWYLPTQPGMRGRTLRIRYDPADGWRLDTDEYIKTNQHVPADRIDAVTDWTIGTGTSSLPVEEAVTSIPEDLPNAINNHLIKESNKAERAHDWQRDNEIYDIKQKARDILGDLRKQLRDADYNRIPATRQQIEDLLDRLETELPPWAYGDLIAGARKILAEADRQRR